MGGKKSKVLIRQRLFPLFKYASLWSAALGINPHELFSVAVSPERAIEQLQQALLANMDQAIEHALDKAIEKRCGDVHLINGSLPKNKKGKVKE